MNMSAEWIVCVEAVLEEPGQMAWIEALQRAALAGAARVRFARSTATKNGVATISFQLYSFDADGLKLGDDRDYDLLKAVMTPLERLAEREPDGNFAIVLELASQTLVRT